MAQENVKDAVAKQGVVVEQDADGQDAVGQLSAGDGIVVEQGKRASKEKAPVNKNSIKYILMAMGPGLLAAFAGNDAGGIATYSSAGATFGYSQLWTVPLMCFLLIVVQETAARMGCVTGKGIGPRALWHPPVHAGNGRTAALQHCSYLLRIRRYCVQYGAFWHPNVRLGAYQRADGVAPNCWRIVPPHREDSAGN